MPRIKTTTALEREELAFDLLSRGASVKSVQNTLKFNYGYKMNLKRIYELCRAAYAGNRFPERQKPVASEAA